MFDAVRQVNRGYPAFAEESLDPVTIGEGGYERFGVVVMGADRWIGRRASTFFVTNHQEPSANSAPLMERRNHLSLTVVGSQNRFRLIPARLTAERGSRTRPSLHHPWALMWNAEMELAPDRPPAMILNRQLLRGLPKPQPRPDQPRGPQGAKGDRPMHGRTWRPLRTGCGAGRLPAQPSAQAACAYALNPGLGGACVARRWARRPVRVGSDPTRAATAHSASEAAGRPIDPRRALRGRFIPPAVLWVDRLKLLFRHIR